MSDRREQLAQALDRLRERIANAAVEAGRDAGEVLLVAVTKTFPDSDARLLTELGVRDLGENRDQEAAAKAATLRVLDTPPRWHMVGRLQRNKARSVVRWADVVQSVDSPRLADALADATARALHQGERRHPLEVLLQVSLDTNPARGGCPIPELPALADRVADHTALRLRGVMAVAPLDADPDEAFARLHAVSTALRARHPDAVMISAGMTADLEAAIRHGSTCVRVGTALLGGRPLASR
jgi:pyridoxal phosphate enzyme (YggS family)